MYVLDTNTFRILERYYPSNFPSFWKSLDEAVDDGGICSVEEVYKELQNGSPTEHLLNWCEINKKSFFAPSKDELFAVRDIFSVKHFQQLIGEKQLLKGSPVADPFLIARAKITNGCVVTEERPKENSAKIPNVCSRFDVDYCNLEQLMTRLDWRF